MTALPRAGGREGPGPTGSTMHDTLQKGQYVEKRFRADPGDVEVKDAEKEEGRRTIRMPVSSTAQDRDGDQFSEEGLEDLQRQFNEEKIPMFLDHGRGSRGSYYGALGIVGRWDAAEIQEEGDVKVLYATGTPTDANPDAEEAVKLIEDEMPVGASVGFRVLDYDGDRQDGYEFHQSDLLETSLVGIPSNPETVNAGTGGVAAKVAGLHPAVMQQLTAGAAASDVAPDEQPATPTQARDAPGDTMTDSDNDNDTDELRETVKEQTETVEQLTDSIDTLVDTIDGRSDTDPDEDPDAEGKGEGEEPEEPDRRELSVVLDEDTDDETAAKEFEALKEHANDDGEISLDDSKTRLFPEDDDTDDHDTSDEKGGLI